MCIDSQPCGGVERATAGQPFHPHRVVPRAFLGIFSTAVCQCVGNRHVSHPFSLSHVLSIRGADDGMVICSHSATLAFLQSENALLATLLTELKARFPDIDIASHDHDEL